MSGESKSTIADGGKSPMLEKVRHREPSRELWVATVGLIAATVFHLQSKYISSQAAAGTYLGLLGPFITLLLSSHLANNSQKSLLQDYVNVAIFAAASAAVVGLYVPFLPLIGLNVTGALLDGIFLILNKVAEKDGAREDEVSVLETFRGTFFGVWTSFSGMVVEFISLTIEQNPGVGLIYLLTSLLLSAFTHEVGLRIGGWLEENQYVDAKSMMNLSNWLPYIFSYVACSSFFFIQYRAIALELHFIPAWMLLGWSS
mmetsp:Transcript_5640/g.6647  ORF Transcript_5640/g.6647 Transcript_5640/m.6647 type:complete len:258 (-) Transcript_5640:489-1262(-)